MDAVLGIAGRDPNTLRDYVIIASDSRGKPKGNLITDEAKKIFSSKSSNYAIGTAGKCLQNYFSKIEQQPFSDFLNNPGKRDFHYVNEMVRYIDGILLQAEQESNQFVLSMVEEEPKLMLFTQGKKFIDAGSHISIGEDAEELMFGRGISPLKMRVDAYRSGGRIYLTQKEAADALFDSINDIAMYYDTTGGIMKFSIINPTGIASCMQSFAGFPDALPIRQTEVVYQNRFYKGFNDIKRLLNNDD